MPDYREVDNMKECVSDVIDLIRILESERDEARKELSDFRANMYSNLDKLQYDIAVIASKPIRVVMDEDKVALPFWGKPKPISEYFTNDGINDVVLAWFPVSQSWRKTYCLQTGSVKFTWYLLECADFTNLHPTHFYPLPPKPE